MVKNPPTLDYVKILVYGCQFKDVCLNVINVLDAEFPGFPQGKGKAAQAQVHGQYARVRESGGRVYGILARATARHQDFRALGRLVVSESKAKWSHLQNSPNSPAFVSNVGLDPAGVWVLLILLANRLRD